MAYETEPIVSSDISCSTYSSTFDSLATMVLGENVSKTLSWYDAGYGYAHRVVELIERFDALDRGGFADDPRRDQRLRPDRPDRVPHPQRPQRHRGRRHQRPLRQRAARVPPEVRHGDARLRQGGAGRGRHDDGGRPPGPHDGGEGPGEAPLGKARRGRRRRGHGQARDAREAAEAPRRGSETGHPDGAAEGRDRRDDRRGRQRRRAASRSTGSSRTPRARRTASRRSRRSWTRRSASRTGS